jgi:serine/threonine protein kinase/tetratricopeptide (TPR) repeat protein
VPVTPVPSEKPGDEIRGYKLLEQIGHGGFGVVYLAEQREPVRRRVALKVIKLGMDTKQVVARFESERQALALMDHPNIAKILEAGATETGRPYFVMELVGGIKITDYCEQNDLTTRQRLELFMQVCRAVQHAHQKGVIHRDIKPSNVLVATQDGVPVPKVIDFGIAKATQGRLTDQTVFTAFEQFLGTPAYMSPEQAQVGGLDVDTRSDIYSLGVLLYELLTGKTPFDAKQLLAAGLEAMRRTIQEKEPPTPSTRLKQDFETQRTGHPTDSKIKNQKSKIANDLDWIVMKCLEKDRARRYETANGLARDIERHLTNEPVSAGRPSRLYRFEKLVRRNRATAAAIAVVTLVLVLGVTVSTWQAIRATLAKREQSRLRQQAQEAQAKEIRERQKAETEAAKSEQVAQFLKDMLGGVGPSVAQGRDTTILREILNKTAERVGNELTNQPEVQIELLNTIGNTYSELGLYERMEETAREGVRLARTYLGERHEATVDELEQLATAQRELGRFEEAETTLRDALTMRRQFFSKNESRLGGVLNSLALVLDSRGKFEEAEAMFAEAVELGRKNPQGETDLASALANLGMALRHEGKLAQAEAKYREALAMDRKHLGNEHPNLASSLNSLGTVLRQQGKLQEAEVIFREVLALRRKLLGDEHPNTIISLYNLARTLANESKFAEAEAAYEEVLVALRKEPGKESRLGLALDGQAELYDKQGKLNECEAALRESLAIGLRTLGHEHPQVGTAVDHLTGVLIKAGKSGEAETLCRDHLLALRGRLPADDPELAYAVVQLAVVLLDERKFAEAEPLAREGLAIREKKQPDDWRSYYSRRIVGSSLLGQKKYAEAEPLLVDAYEGMNQRQSEIPIENKKFLKEALQNLAQLYAEMGQADRAAIWEQKVEEFERVQTNRVISTAQPKPPQ